MNTLLPDTAGVAYFSDAVTTLQQVKGSRGTILSLRLVNTVAVVGYLQVFFRPVAQVTLGSTAPDFAVRLAVSQDLYLDFQNGVSNPQGTGITVAGTTTAGGATPNAISVLMSYQ